MGEAYSTHGNELKYYIERLDEKPRGNKPLGRPRLSAGRIILKLILTRRRGRGVDTSGSE